MKSLPNIIRRRRTHVSSGSSSVVCPPNFEINEEKDEKLNASPVILLVPTDYKDVFQSGKRTVKAAASISAPKIGKCQLQNRNKNKKLIKQSYMCSTPTSSSSSQNKLKMSCGKNATNKNKYNYVVSNTIITSHAKDIDISQIHNLGGMKNIKSCDSKCNILSSSTSNSNVVQPFVPYKEGACYKVIDEGGAVTSVTADSLCRICGRFGKDHLISLSSDICCEYLITETIDKYLPIKIKKDDGKLPGNICHLCVSYLIDWQRLVTKCEATDKWLHEIFNVEYDATESTKAEKCSIPEQHYHLQKELEEKIASTEVEASSIKIVTEESLQRPIFWKANRIEQHDHDYCGSQIDAVEDNVTNIDTNDYYDDNDVQDDNNCSKVEHINDQGSPAVTVTSNNGNSNVEASSVKDMVICQGEAVIGDCSDVSVCNNVKLQKRECINSLDDEKLSKKKKSNNLPVNDEKNLASTSEVGDCENNNNADEDNDQLMIEMIREVKDSADNSTKAVECTKNLCAKIDMDTETTDGNDENRSDALLSPPQDSLLNTLSGGREGENINNDCTVTDINESTSSPNKDEVLPGESDSSDKYIAKQRYKVTVTVTSRIVKEKTSDSESRNKSTPTSLLAFDNMESINITISKEDKSNRKRYRNVISKSKSAYSRLAIFDCEYCVVYQMTADEFGKHMKVFHLNRPLRCPICKRVFKQDYNLIIHLQVTPCAKLDSHNNNSSGNCNGVSPEKDRNICVNSSPSTSKRNELSVTIKPSDYKPLVGYFVNPGADKCDVNKTDILVNPNLFDTEKSVFEIRIETWKPSIINVSFKSGIVIVDGLQFLGHKLRSIVSKEIENLLKLRMYSSREFIRLTEILERCKPSEAPFVTDSGSVLSRKMRWKGSAALEEKESQVLNITQADNDVTTIKSVASTKDNLGNSKPLMLNTTKASLKRAFRPKKPQCYFKDIHGVGVKCSYSGSPFTSRPSDLPNNELKRNLICRGKNVDTRRKNESKVLFISCDKCNMKFMNQRLFYGHLKRHHINTKCKYCDDVFDVLHELRVHEKEHRRNNKLHCKICDIKFMKIEAIQKHNLINHNIGEYATCEYCGKKFYTKTSLQTHRKNVHSTEQHLCPHCGQTYKSSAGLKRHIQTCHIEQIRAVCHECNRTFANRIRLNVHMRIHRRKDKKFTCEICQKSFFTNTGIKQHQHRHLTEKVAFCLICGSGSKRMSQINFHIKETHWTTVNKPANEQFPCLVCGIMSENGYTLAQHMMFHAEEKVVEDVCGTDDAGDISCQDCGKYLKTKKELAMHKFYTHKDLPFKCYIDDCNMNFWSKAALDAHGKASHCKFYYECKRCNENFKSLKLKYLHMETVHKIQSKRSMVRPPPSPRMCELCEKSFSSKSSLNRHQTMVHYPFKMRLNCELCGKCFSHKQKLDRHMQTHARPKSMRRVKKKEKAENIIIEETSFVVEDFVDYCDNSGGELNYLENEGNTISNVTQGEEFCDFSDRVVQEYNKEEDIEKVNHESSLAAEKLISMFEAYKCTTCEITFKDRLELHNHFRIVHKNVQHISFEPNEILELSVIE